MPLADGGEGTLDAVLAAGGWQALPAAADDPLGRPVEARFLRDARPGRAVVELAAASGLSLVAPESATPWPPPRSAPARSWPRPSASGVAQIVLGLGGQRHDRRWRGAPDRARGPLPGRAPARTLPPGGAGAGATWPASTLTDLSPLLAEVSLTIASDVTNPLLGELGAAATYGPQKGASPDAGATARPRA